MSKFSWQSEEAWDDEIHHPVPEPSSRPWRRYLLIGALAAVLIGALAALSFWRVDAVNQEISAEVISSHALIQDAVRLQDRELFLSVLSGRSDGWVLTQDELFSQFNLDIRPVMGLDLDEDLSNDVTLSVELDPGLTSATLYRVQSYRDRFGRPVDLQLTDVYRLGQTRWLLAPPEAEFWGEWVEFEEPGALIEAKFPERDAPYVWFVQEYLDEKIKILCLDSAFECPPDLKIKIVFHHDPYTLLQTAEPEFAYQRVDQIVVPTPTLIGLPLDEQGQQVMARTYASFILPKIIVDLIDYDCCLHQFPLLAAFIERQLIELEVLPPVDQTAQADVFFSDPFFPSPAGLEEGVAVDDQLLHQRGLLLADYYTARTDLTIGDLILNTSYNGRRWINSANQALMPGGDRRYDLYSDFVHFASSRAGPGPADLPAQNLGIICEIDVERWITGSYDFNTGQWDLRSIDYQGPIDGLRQLNGDGWVWIDQKSQKIYRLLQNRLDIVHQDSPMLFSLFFGESLGTISYGRMNQENGTWNSLFISAEACASGDCAFNELEDEGFLFWNPSGDMALVYGQISGGETPQFALIGSDGRPLGTLPVVNADRVYWENNDSLLITRQDGNPNDMGFFRVELDTLEEEKLFDWSQVVKSLPENDFESTRLFPSVVSGIPNREDHFFMLIGLAVQDNPLTHMIIYDGVENRVIFSQILDHFMGYRTVTAGGSSYVVILSHGNDGQRYIPTLLDTDQMEIVQAAGNPFAFVVTTQLQIDYFSRLDWSEDGRWLAQLNAGFATAVDLKTGQKKVIPYPRELQACAGGGWVNF